MQKEKKINRLMRQIDWKTTLIPLAGISKVFDIQAKAGLTIIILLIIAVVYTLTVWFGMKGISRAPSFCAYLFFVLLVYFLLGGYIRGLAGTFTSFIILGNYGLAQEMKHSLDTVGKTSETGDVSGAIICTFETLPLPTAGIILLVITMIAFYSTTFDTLTMVVSSYSYKKLDIEQEPDKRIRTFWSILFILFPIALIFSENSLNSLQPVSIIAAFPIGIILIVIVAGLIKDAG